MAVVEGKNRAWNVPGGSGIKGQASSSGSVGSILGGRTETPHALEQLSPHALEPVHHNEKISHGATKMLCATDKTHK